MKILILGGTAWLGHSIAAAALAAGHSVVCLARGNTIPEGADLVNADRARDDALAGIAARTWDAVVDVAGDPRFVERAVRDLAPAAKRFVFVSSLNVYADPSKKGIVEDEPTLPPLPEGEEASQENYGRAKSACEAAVLAGFGRERSTIVPKQVTLADVFAGKYDNVLVAVDGVQFDKPYAKLNNQTGAKPQNDFLKMTDCATALPAGVDALAVIVVAVRAVVSWERYMVTSFCLESVPFLAL